jgi:hypothetical protein
MKKDINFKEIEYKKIEKDMIKIFDNAKIIVMDKK